jgi:2-isopropylmalate synthase
VKHARKPRIHTFVSTSPIHLEHQMRKSQEEVLDIIHETVTLARNLSTTSSGRPWTPPARRWITCARCVDAAIKAGATTINLPDTVGYTVPDEMRHLFKTVRENVANSDKAVFSAHCHNDLGMAVANSLAAIEGGVRQIECTINGLGERAGNAALEEVVMAIKTRNDVLPYACNVKPEYLTGHPSWCRRCRLSRCSTTRPSWAATPLRTKAAFTRTAC